MIQRASPSKESSFGVGLVIGLALAITTLLSLAVVTYTATSEPTAEMHRIVVSSDDFVVATATPVWRFRSEWLTPHAAER